MKREHQERKHINDRLTPRRQWEKSMKDMQDDASKEGNDVVGAIICLPTQKHTKFSPGKTKGWRPKQRLQRGEVRSDKRTHCRPDETGPSFRRPLEPTSRSPPPKTRSSQSMERQLAAIDGGDEKLLQERRPRVTTTTLGGGRISPASPLPTTNTSSNTRRRGTVSTEATELT
jgi:hypothetical protein